MSGLHVFIIGVTLSQARDAVCSQIVMGWKNPSVFRFECFFTLGSVVPLHMKDELKSENFSFVQRKLSRDERPWEDLRFGPFHCYDMTAYLAPDEVSSGSGMLAFVKCE